MNGRPSWSRNLPGDKLRSFASTDAVNVTLFLHFKIFYVRETNRTGGNCSSGVGGDGPLLTRDGNVSRGPPDHPVVARRDGRELFTIATEVRYTDNTLGYLQSGNLIKT